MAKSSNTRARKYILQGHMFCTRQPDYIVVMYTGTQGQGTPFPHPIQTESLLFSGKYIKFLGKHAFKFWANVIQPLLFPQLEVVVTLLAR